MSSNMLEPVQGYDHKAHVFAPKPVWHHDRTNGRGSWQRQEAKAKETTRVVGYNLIWHALKLTLFNSK